MSKIVAASWLVLEPPPAFVAALEALQDEERWREGREQLYAMCAHPIASDAHPQNRMSLLPIRGMGFYRAGGDLPRWLGPSSVRQGD